MGFEVVRSDRVAVVAPPASLIQRYAPVLAACIFPDSETELVPVADLPDLIAEIERALLPAPPQEVAKAVAVMFGSFKIGDVVHDQQAFTRAMIAELDFPADILQAAVRQARRTLKWLPSIAEMIEICEDVKLPRVRQLRTAKDMVREHQRREKAAAEREESARQYEARKAEFIARMPEFLAAAENELRARGHSPEEIEDKLSTLRMWPDDQKLMAEISMLEIEWSRRVRKGDDPAPPSPAPAPR